MPFKSVSFLFMKLYMHGLYDVKCLLTSLIIGYLHCSTCISQNTTKTLLIRIVL